MFRKFVRLGFVAVLGLMNGACVLWPGLGSDNLDQQRYAKIHADLTEARMYAHEVRGKLEDYEASGDDLENAETYALSGLGIASAVNLASNGSRGPLKSFGLAAAGILGLDAVLKPRQQQAAVRLGIDGISCALDQDLALDRSVSRAFTPAASGVPFKAYSSLSSLQSDLGNAPLATVFQQAASGTISTETASAHVLAATMAAPAATRLLLAAQGATNQSDRAAALADATIQIRKIVNEAIRKGVDPTKVSDAFKSAYSGTAGNVNNAHQQAIAQRDALLSNPGLASAPEAVKTLQALNAVIAQTDPVANQFQKCIDQATGNSKGSGST